MTDPGDVQRRGRRGALAFVIVVSASFVHCGLRQDELECEEAVSHLVDCCPGFDPTKLNCTHENGCDYERVTTLSVSESRCILGRSCSTVVASKICSRLTTELTTGTVNTSSDSVQTQQAEDVCP